MAIDAKHPEFCEKNSSVCKDAYAGTVKGYVPKLQGQSNQEYDDYCNRGVYFNATKKTVDGMVGAILRKPFETNMDDVEIYNGLNLHEFIATNLKDVINTGRCGMLVDYDEVNQTPYLVSYEHETICNWRKDGSLVVLSEMIYVEDPKDPYTLNEATQYRELYIDEFGYYAVRLWRMDGSNKYYIYDQFEPSIRGSRLDHIPFVYVNPFDTTCTIFDPVILNVAQINISHFKSVVDVEHGTHFTALPTPIISGDFSTDVEGEVSIGSTTPWQLTEGSTATYLEFQGTGLASIEKRIESKEMQMAAVGSKLLADKKGVEAAESLRIRGAAESSALVNLVNAMESAMVQILEHYNMWFNDAPVEFTMSRDFSGGLLSAQDMTALMNLYLNGTISQETFLENMYEGEITTDVELELTRLAGEPDKNSE